MERQYRTFRSADVIAAFAGQGVPIETISRALVLTESQVQQVCERAVDSGYLVKVPPMRSGDRRDELLTELVNLRQKLADACRAAKDDDEDSNVATICALRLAFGLAPAEARILSLFLKRSHLTKDKAYFEMFGHLLPEDQPEPKIIDVYICKVRRKLPDDIPIETLWGQGWNMSADSARKIRERARLPIKESPSIVPDMREAA